MQPIAILVTVAVITLIAFVISLVVARRRAAGPNYPLWPPTYFFPDLAPTSDITPPRGVTLPQAGQTMPYGFNPRQAREIVEETNLKKPVGWHQGLIDSAAETRVNQVTRELGIDETPTSRVPHAGGQPVQTDIEADDDPTSRKRSQHSQHDDEDRTGPIRHR